MNPFLGLVIAIIALFANAFFVCAEFGLISVRRSNIEIEKKKGTRFASTTLKAMGQMSIMLAGIQLGVTVASLVLGAVSEPAIAHITYPMLEMFSIDSSMLHPISIVIALTVTSFFHVVIGEMVPKNLALASPTKIALVCTPLLVLFVKITRPVVLGISSINNRLLKLLKIPPKHEIDSTFGSDELAGFVQESFREGLLSSEEEQMLSGALSFDNLKIKSVAIIPEKIKAIDKHLTHAQIESLSAETGFSRFPITSGKGNYIGYVHIKDLIGLEPKEYYQILSSDYIRPFLKVPSTVSLRKGLAMMQKAGAHLAQIVDSRGATVGFVALEDILEELVGTIKEGNYSEAY